MNHSKKAQSLVFVSCHCGFRWYNENLREPDKKQKSDITLEAEREYEFNKHIQDLFNQGY